MDQDEICDACCQDLQYVSMSKGFEGTGRMNYRQTASSRRVGRKATGGKVYFTLVFPLPGPARICNGPTGVCSTAANHR